MTNSLQVVGTLSLPAGDAGAGLTTMAMTGADTLTGADVVQLRCASISGDEVVVRAVELTAVKVGTLTSQ